MTTLTPNTKMQPVTRDANPLAQAWRTSPGLTVLAVSSLALIVLSALGLFLDPRTTAILNTPTWAKTFKFSVSLALYSAGLIWAINLTRNQLRPGLSSRITAISGGAVGWILSLELILIVIQAVRAQPMHYNVSTAFDETLWNIMSIGISLMLLAFIVLMISVWRGLRTNPVMAWAMRLGLIVTLVGLLQGSLMPQPTPAQLQALESSQKLGLIGAHTVGSNSLTPDNGPGLPLLGWSTTHGDLRIGHFVGLHGLQLIPLLGLFLSRRRERWFSSGHRIAVVAVGAVSYLGLVALVTWQALRGQPLIAPDAPTIMAFVGLIAFAFLSGFGIITHARVTARAVTLQHTNSTRNTV